MIKLYNGKKIIGEVKKTRNLDYLVGKIRQNNKPGLHLGYGRLKNGQFYFVYTNDWKNGRKYAKITTIENVIIEAIKSENIRELEQYKDLYDLFLKKWSHKKITISKVFSIRIRITDSDEMIKQKIKKLKNKIDNYTDLY
jgi:hypothetical protein